MIIDNQYSTGITYARFLVRLPAGYSEHPEIFSRLLVKKGHDYVKDDPDAKDDLDSGFLLFPGHGTGTSSVIVSPKGAQGDPTRATTDAKFAATATTGDIGAVRAGLLAKSTPRKH